MDFEGLRLLGQAAPLREEDVVLRTQQLDHRLELLRALASQPAAAAGRRRRRRRPGGAADARGLLQQLVRRLLQVAAQAVVLADDLAHGGLQLQQLRLRRLQRLLVAAAVALQLRDALVVRREHRLQQHLDLMRQPRDLRRELRAWAQATKVCG